MVAEETYAIPRHPTRFTNGCEICIQGGMRAKKSTNTLTEGGLRKYHQTLETASTDNLHLADIDVDGNKAASGVFIRKTSYGDLVMLKSMSSVAKEKAWVNLSRDIQSNTDPGPMYICIHIMHIIVHNWEV